MEENFFQHFIITRFNLKQNVWNKDKFGSQVNDDIWLKDRYSLFITYCFPSLEAQVNLNFKWLVYFDTNTPLMYKHKNEDLKEQFANFYPLYIDNIDELKVACRKDIQDLQESNSKFVITTRIDNDDCFHENTVAKIQENFF